MKHTRTDPNYTEKQQKINQLFYINLTGCGFDWI